MKERIAVVAMLGAAIFLAGCSRAAWGGALAGVSAGVAQSGQSKQTKLMLFGGEGHRTYLGCLNCSEYATDSVSNKYGTYGSSYSTESIFNQYGEFGSKYSNYGACNPYATDPPVIVDEAGTYYGRLTLNQYHAEIGNGRNLLGWLKAVCTH